jgi:aldose sugar dehydrogenase
MDERGARRPVTLLLVGLILMLAAPPLGALPEGTKIQPYVSNLDFPVDAVRLPGTRIILFTEKYTGKIRVLRRKNLQSKACVTLNVATLAERGLLGITIHSDFETNSFLYVYYTAAPTDTRPAPVNRVDRFTYDDGLCRNRTRIVNNIHSSPNHNGGQLEFLDGKLFVAVGDGQNAGRAQELDSRLGKILRYNPNGSIPASNPFNEPGDPNPVWSYGHRNPFGLAVREETGQLFESQNGPECDDEVNLVLEGENYGWGADYGCFGIPEGGSGYDPVGDDPEEPLFRFRNGYPTVAPADAWWYSGRMDELADSLYVTEYKTHRLHRFNLSEDGTTVESHGVVYNSNDPLLDVFEGPGGWLYVMSYDAIRRIVPD